MKKAAIKTTRGLTKKVTLKTPKALLVSVVLIALAVGCESTTPRERDHSLAAAGFKLYPAENPKQVRWIDSLPENRITPVQRDGTTYYTYPDRRRQSLYVGREREYRQLRIENQRVAERLSPPEFYNAALWGPWVW